jgi:hypothetical protein
VFILRGSAAIADSEESAGTMFLPFSRKIVDSLPEDPFEAILAIIADFRRVMAIVDESLSAKELRDRQRYEIVREACALLSAYLKREGFAIIIPRLPHEGGKLGEEEEEREGPLPLPSLQLSTLSMRISLVQHMNERDGY